MIISFDWDGTVNEDRPTWATIIALLRSKNHTVIFTTQRDEQTGKEVTEYAKEVEDDFGVGPLPVVFASGKPKLVATLGAGYEVDVWVEGHPASVFNGYTYIGEVIEDATTEDSEDS